VLDRLQLERWLFGAGWAKDVIGGRSERLAAVEDDEDALLDVKATADEAAGPPPTNFYEPRDDLPALRTRRCRPPIATRRQCCA
jgi:hypothetical protein